jgi:hypothetical protein
LRQKVWIIRISPTAGKYKSQLCNNQRFHPQYTVFLAAKTINHPKLKLYIALYKTELRVVVLSQKKKVTIAHARPSARPLSYMSGRTAHISAESPSNISPKDLESFYFCYLGAHATIQNLGFLGFDLLCEEERRLIYQKMGYLSCNAGCTQFARTNCELL